MEIQSSQKFCIITPLSPKLDARETNRLVEELKSHAHQTVGLDLSYVQDCTIDFLDAAREFKAGFFNIQSDIFSLLTLMNFDNFINLYTTEEDFLCGKHRLLNRKFSIV